MHLFEDVWGDSAPPILNRNTRWTWLVSFIPNCLTLPGRRVRWGRRLRRAQSQSGHCGSRPRAPPILCTGYDVLHTSQANSRRPSTVVTRVRAQASPCGICDAQSGIDTVLLPTTLVFLCHYHSTIHLTPSL